MKKKQLSTTLVRVHRDLLPLLRELRALMGLRYDREIIGVAVNDFASRQANNTFNAVVKKNGGIVHAKKKKTVNVRRSR